MKTRILIITQDLVIKYTNTLHNQIFVIEIITLCA